ncbi:MAG: AMMECR1 domain-containing protein [bacterium]|nr:AMMECR1 domain-containing protein [bacterium]
MKILSILFFTFCLFSKGQTLQQIGDESLRIARETLQIYLKTNKKPLLNSFLSSVPPRSLFIILNKNGQTRGCSGSFKPFYSSLGESIINFTIIASTQDTRYSPIKIEEIDEIKIMIAFPEEIVPINSPFQISPLNEGLIIKKDGKEGVVLPGEAKTVNYAIKIGMKNARIENLDGAIFYKFKCEIFKEK